jgi:DNA-binding transcriptional ArsR family regulator
VLLQERPDRRPRQVVELESEGHGATLTSPCAGDRIGITYNPMVVDDVVATDRIFGALADGTRRDILARTARGPESVSGLARHYAMSFAAVQKHVAVLERAELVTKERRGREQLVRAHPPTLRRAAELLEAYQRLWEHRVEAITDILSEGERT